MYREQKIRAFLFYLSLFTFFVGLPFILSFALGYKFNTRIFKFIKTGLIDLKTQPEGANIYLDEKLLNESTPANIYELLPGAYTIRLELEGHYPWFSQIIVEAGKVTQLDKIILFPLRPDIKQLNKTEISSFWADEKEARIYYVNQKDGLVYNSDSEGGDFKKIGKLPKIIPFSQRWKLSRDKEKLLGFNQHQIAIAYLDLQHQGSPNQLPFVLNFTNRKIAEVFWHSDSYHLILVTDRDIEVLEARPKVEPVSLVNLNKKNCMSFYDVGRDTLYFLDSEKGIDGKLYDNAYKLDLRSRFSQPKEPIRERTDESR